MANPQKENGYTAIANELLEVVARVPLPGRHLRLWLFVARKTWGWHKKRDRISLSQLQKGTFIDRTGICRIVKQLVAWRLLVKHNSLYSIGKDYDRWVVARAPLGSGVEDNRVVARAPHTKETITKETISGSPSGDPAPSMKRTDERKFDADYIPSVDEDGNPIISKPETKGGKEMKRLLLWAIKRRKSYFVNAKKQYKAMQMMRLAGIDPGKIEDRWIEMENDRFYRANGFDFMDVANSFDKKP